MTQSTPFSVSSFRKSQRRKTKARPSRSTPSTSGSSLERETETAGLDLTVTAADGHPLAARFFRVIEGFAIRGAVLVVPAMGVAQRFYEPLALWLVSQGFHVLTFDYRGVGRSRHEALRKVDATIESWGNLDAAAALAALAARTDDAPVTWLGHSLGGHILPFVPAAIRERSRLAKVVTVAAGSGYWRENAPALRRVVWAFWYGLVPLTTPLFGYFPGARLGTVGDLPRGVITQWRKWALHRDYAVGAEGERARVLFDAVRVPFVSLSFTDDEMMSAANIASLHGHYTSAQPKMVCINPADVGLDRIGHFGFFRPELEPVWATHLLPELAG